ncbi:hypothetical protein [Brevundimonas sp. MF30-B]|uniref:hypothetical protein n=1 Tax=Brevundimonas sp. MF30-B TaxID=2561924 RepID=UPI00107629A3|nr:hypothetical protein [Brevundimonas sp. MF30-B]QBX38112.1 hypothetical protein E4M01_10250 [Brevundimonas sp. MF30-B]
MLLVGGGSLGDEQAADPAISARCLSLAHGLRRLGHDARCLSQWTFDQAADRLLGFDIYGFHRPTLTTAFSRAYHDLEPKAAATVDFDDFSFDMRRMAQDELPPCFSTLDQAARCAEALSLFTRGTFASKDQLARAVEIAPGLQGVVLPGDLSARAGEWLELATGR